MNSTMRWSTLGVLTLALLTGTTGCARQDSIASPSYRPPALANWDDVALRTISVVALGPTQMTNRHWYEFEPGVKQWLADGPTVTTYRHRPGIGIGNAFATGTQETLTQFAQTASAGPAGLIVGLALAPVQLAVSTTKGALTPGPKMAVTRPLGPVDREDLALAILPEKRELSAAIGKRVAQLGQETTDHGFVTVPFEALNNSSSWPDGADNLITVRVTRVGFVAGGVGNPATALHVHLWVHVNHYVFRSFVHTSPKRTLGAWLEDDGRPLQKEVDLAIQNLAAQVIEELFLVSAESSLVKFKSGESDEYALAG